MQPRIFTSVILFISAYSPLFLILIVKDFNFEAKEISTNKDLVINYNPNTFTKLDSIRLSKTIDYYTSKDEKTENTKLYSFNNPKIVAVVVFISIISIILLFVMINKLPRGNMVITVKDVKSRSLDVINYIIPYLFCAFDIDISNPADIITIAFFLFILLILTIKTQSIFINPILALGGYAFFDLEYEYDKKTATTVVISKYNMQTGERYYLTSLTRFLYFVKERKKQTNAS